LEYYDRKSTRRCHRYINVDLTSKVLNFHDDEFLPSTEADIYDSFRDDDEDMDDEYMDDDDF
jgi:hypothetical protein